MVKIHVQTAEWVVVAMCRVLEDRWNQVVGFLGIDFKEVKQQAKKLQSN